MVREKTAGAIASVRNRKIRVDTSANFSWGYVMDYAPIVLRRREYI